MWIGIVAVAGVLMCGGVLGWVVVSFQSRSPQTAEYREHREPIGGSMPASVVSALEDPQPVTDLEPDLETFVQSLALEPDVNQVVDLSRFTLEMQNSGRAVGVNGLTRLVWIENLRYALTLPPLSEDITVLDVRWIVPEEEACVTVTSSWDTYSPPEVWLLYVHRNSQQWKLYDWRDVMEAASESQYFAMFSAVSERVQDNYSDLTMDVHDIYFDDDIAWDEKASRTWTTYRSRTYPDEVRPLAQAYCAYYLDLYDAKDQLESLAREIRDNSFAGAHYYKGRLALLQDEPQEAFHQATLLVEKLGWHPAAALLAADAAESADQREQACQWLAKSILVMPKHASSLSRFLKLCTAEQLQRLVQDVAKLPHAKDCMVALVDTLVSDEKADGLRRLQTATQGVDGLDSIAVYTQLYLAVVEDDHQQVIQSAPALLNDPQWQSEQERIWNFYTSAAKQGRLLQDALENAPDKMRFHEQLRDQLLSRWVTDEDWPAILEIFTNLPSTSWLKDQIETDIVVARCRYELGDASGAYDQLESRLNSEGVVLLGDDAPEYAMTYFDVLAKAAIDTEQIQEFTNAVAEPETAFVVLASKLDERWGTEPSTAIDQLEELTNWYAMSGSPPVWTAYYRSRIAFARNQWEQMDEQLAIAADEAEFDARISDYSLPSIVMEFSPDVEDLFTQRLDLACRFGKLPELIDKARAQNEFDASWADEISWLLGDFDATDMATIVGQKLQESDDRAIRWVGQELIADVYLADDQPEDALELLITQAYELASDGQDDGNSALTRAIEVMATTGQVARLPELRLMARTDRDRAFIDCTSAVVRGNAEEFLAVIEKCDDEYATDHWFWQSDLICVQQEAGIWSRVNARHAADVENLTYDFSAYGVVLIDQNWSEAKHPIRTAFERQIDVELTEHDAANFPGTSDVWTAELPTGRLVLVGCEGTPPNADAQAHYYSRLAKYPSTLSVYLMRTSSLVEPFQALRELVAGVGQNTDMTRGYQDYFSDSWFLGDDWADKLMSAANHGIAPGMRKREYLYWDSEQALLDLEHSPPLVRISIGPVTEEIPLTIESNKNQTVLARMESASTLMPCLTAQTRVRVDTD